MLTLPLVAAALSLASSASAGPSSRKDFVYASGTKFKLGSKDYYFAGSNAYWFQFLPNMTDVEIAMDKAAEAGVKVIRTWGFNEVNVTTLPDGLPKYGGEGAGPTAIYFQSWENGKPTINYGPNGLQRFDKVIKAAEKRGLKLVIALTNNWADYGGMDMYTVNLGGRYHDDFFTMPAVKKAWKNYVKTVINRYKDSPAIFSWQLGNEPRCGADGTRNLPRGPNCTVELVTSWADEMSRYVKSLDPHHMVNIGAEGFYNIPGHEDWAYNGADGLDFDALLKLPKVDYGTFHCYPDWWSKTSDWTTEFVNAHGKSQKKIGKPVVMEEYGWLRDADRQAWLGRSSNVTRLEALSAWQAAALKHKLAGTQYWQFGVDGLSIGRNHNDGFTIYLDDPEAPTLVYQHVKDMEKLNKPNWWDWIFRA